MNNRHNRRAELARFRRETSGGLVTWLVDRNDPSLHKAPTLLVQAAFRWCEELLASPRHCICCLSLICDQREVGGLLLSKPHNAIGRVAINGVCKPCWAAQSLDQIEHAATEVLRAVVRTGNFEPLSSIE